VVVPDALLLQVALRIFVIHKQPMKVRVRDILLDILEAVDGTRPQSTFTLAAPRREIDWRTQARHDSVPRIATIQPSSKLSAHEAITRNGITAVLGQVVVRSVPRRCSGVLSGRIRHSKERVE